MKTAVAVWLKETNSPLNYIDVKSTYTKGDLFCIMMEDGDGTVVTKYPIVNIWRIQEVMVMEEGE